MTVAKDWKRWYAALRAADEDVYRKAIQYAEAVSLNHGLDDKAAAACEVSHVALACELLHIKPGRRASTACGTRGARRRISRPTGLRNLPRTRLPT
jgi:hypothetical protein